MAIKKKTSSSKPSAARSKPRAKPAAKPAARAKSTTAKTAAKPKSKPKPKVKLKKSPSGRVLPKTKKSAAKATGTKAGAKKKLTGKKPTLKSTPVKKPKVAREAPVLAENPEGLALARRAAELLLEKKAEAVVLIDVRGRTSYTDYLLVASAEIERQVAALAEAVDVGLKAEGHRVISAEGHTPGQWVLLDYGDVVVHLFTREARPFYDLEGMWPDAPKETLR